MARAPQNGKEKNGEGKWFFIIGVLLVLWLISMIIAGVLSFIFSVGNGSDISAPIGQGNIAIIPIKGEITSEKTTTIFSQGSVSSEQTLKFIDTANNDPSVKAIIFDIDSPGGSPVASEDIMNAVKESRKYGVAVIRDLGTSGAYWVASAADKIIASRLSLTGSVGVYSSYLDFQGTFDKYGVTYERLVGGKYKDIGTPFRNMTDEERYIFQDKIGKIHSYFLNSVAENRNLTQGQIAVIKDGEFFTGEEAMQYGLIDDYGNINNAVKLIEQNFNMTGKTVEYKQKEGFFSSLMSTISKPAFYVGQGIGYAMRDSSFQSAPNVRT